MKQGVTVEDVKDNEVNVNPSIRDVNVNPAVSISANGSAFLSNKKSKSPEDNSVHINVENHGSGTQTVSNVGSTNCIIL